MELSIPRAEEAPPPAAATHVVKRSPDAAAVIDRQEPLSRALRLAARGPPRSQRLCRRGSSQVSPRISQRDLLWWLGKGGGQGPEGDAGFGNAGSMGLFRRERVRAWKGAGHREQKPRNDDCEESEDAIAVDPYTDSDPVAGLIHRRWFDAGAASQTRYQTNTGD